MTECNKKLNYKDILYSFLPLIAAVIIQYAVNFIDVVALFIYNMRSSEKSYSSKSIESIMQQSYNQPMNLAYMTMGLHMIYIICFGIWYYKAFYKNKSAGEKISRRTFLSINTPLLIVAGFFCQAATDGILTMVRPCFPNAFSQYDKLVSSVSGANASWPMYIAVLLLAPIGEELLFRGVIQGYASKYMAPSLAVIFQGLLFGIYHGNPVQGVYAAVLGCILGFVVYKTNCLFPSILLHFCINASLYIIPASWFAETTRCLIITGCTTLSFTALILIITKTRLFSRKKAKNKAEAEKIDLDQK